MHHRFDDSVKPLYQKRHSDWAHTMATLFTLHSPCCGIYDPAMSTQEGNELPKLAPAITSDRGRIMGFDIVPNIIPGDTRSTPWGVGSSVGRIRPSGQGPVEHPTPMRTTGVSLEAVSEPQNAPTVEPLSPV
jgi:hypothetical protein